MSLIRGIFGFVLTAAIALFAIYNRQLVDVSFSPIHAPLSLPLYLIALGLMALGFVLGGAFVWFAQGRVRKTKRQQKKQIKALERELKAINENAPQNLTPSSEFFPALPEPQKRNRS